MRSFRRFGHFFYAMIEVLAHTMQFVPQVLANAEITAYPVTLSSDDPDSAPLSVLQRQLMGAIETRFGALRELLHRELEYVLLSSVERLFPRK